MTDEYLGMADEYLIIPTMTPTASDKIVLYALTTRLAVERIVQHLPVSLSGVRGGGGHVTLHSKACFSETIGPICMEQTQREKHFIMVLFHVIECFWNCLIGSENALGGSA